MYKKVPKVFEKQKYYSVRITSKTITQDILSLGDFGTINCRIPTVFLGSTKAIINWIKAFFSAEAYVNCDFIRLQCVNKEGLLEVSEFLNTLGIENKFYSYSPKKENWSEVFIIIILKKNARKLYFKKIGFFHNKKTMLLKKSLTL